MSGVAYTSLMATQAIAARAVRDIGRTAAEPFKTLRKALDPFTHKVIYRGKLTRHELRPTFEKVVERLRAQENINDIHIGHLSNSASRGMSANESCRLRFIQTVDATYTRNERVQNVAAFAAQDLMMSRRDLKIRINMTGFYMHPHAMARYMQRMQRPYGELLNSILRPMYASAILSHAIGYGYIGLPVRGGILFGNVRTFRTDDPYPLLGTFDKNGSEMIERDGHESDEDPIVVAVLIKTFIDTESLGDLKSKLRTQITQWEAQHAEGIRRFFDDYAYRSTLVDRNEPPEVSAKFIEDAYKSATELVQSPTWVAVLPSAD
jgi:hypothetical protein